MLFSKHSVDDWYLVVTERGGLLGGEKDRKWSSLQQSVKILYFDRGPLKVGITLVKTEQNALAHAILLHLFCDWSFLIALSESSSLIYYEMIAKSCSKKVWF